MVEADGRAVRHYTSLPGVIYNKKLAADRVTKTTSLEDFLKPEWKGKFVTTPYLAGFDVLISEDIWGAKRTEDYVLKMSQQVSGLLGCGAESRIASGEMPVHLIDCSGSAAFEPKMMKVIGLHVLKETAFHRFGYVAIPKNARSPNASILYALWYASPEGQDDAPIHGLRHDRPAGIALREGDRRLYRQGLQVPRRDHRLVGLAEGRHQTAPPEHQAAALQGEALGDRR